MVLFMMKANRKKKTKTASEMEKCHLLTNYIRSHQNGCERRPQNGIKRVCAAARIRNSIDWRRLRSSIHSECTQREKREENRMKIIDILRSSNIEWKSKGIIHFVCMRTPQHVYFFYLYHSHFVRFSYYKFTHRNRKCVRVCVLAYFIFLFRFPSCSQRAAKAYILINAPLSAQHTSYYRYYYTFYSWHLVTYAAPYTLLHLFCLHLRSAHALGFANAGLVNIPTHTGSGWYINFQFLNKMCMNRGWVISTQQMR